MYYKVPYWFRFSGTEKIPMRGNWHLIEVDGIGMFFCTDYSEIDPPPPDVVRRHLIGVTKKRWIIEADSPEDACRIFMDSEGAKKGTRAKALYLDTDEVIEELPHCERLRVVENEFRCGDDFEDCSASGCIIDQCDPPEDCPVLRAQYHLPEELGIHDMKVKRVRGLREVASVV